MPNKSDAQLLRDYAAQGSEPAFAEIVARHTDLVYSAALRQTGSPELAREIAQSVFTDLARKARALAGTLSADASLAGWLFRGTRFAGLKLLRDDYRRQTRERQFMEHFNPASHAGTDSASDWERVAPVLDEAMAELDDDDHEAVLLRYFKNQDFHAVGRALGVSDDTAQKRVSRAVERLREFFAKRGVTVGASGLVVLISANGVLTAPAGLSAAITAAVAGITAVTAGTATALTMSWLNVKSAAAILAAALVAGTGTYFVQQHKLDRAETRQRELAEQQAQLTAARDVALAAAQARNQEADKVRVDAADLARLRNEITQLRQQVAATQNRPTASEPTPPAVAAASNAPGQFITKEQLAFAGYATPEAAVQTLVWAMVTGNYDTLTNSYSSGLQTARARSIAAAAQAARQSGQPLSRQALDDVDERARFEAVAPTNAVTFNGFQIQALKEIRRDYGVDLKVFVDGLPADGGIPGRGTNVITFVKEGSEWKLAKSGKYNAKWDESGDIQKPVP